MINVMLKFIDADENLPEKDNHPFYGNRYSIPVLIANAEIDAAFGRIARYDFFKNGWVYSDLSDGPDPSDYELCYVTHWASLPSKIGLKTND